MNGRGTAPGDLAPALRHRLLAIRTVAVSFGAAARSAHHDPEISAAERDATIEIWRAWSLRALDGHAREIDEVYGEPRDDIAEVRHLLTEELERAYRTVKDA